HLDAAQREHRLELEQGDGGEDEQPALHPAEEGPDSRDDPAREDVVAARPGHDRRERRKDQPEKDTGRTDDEGGPRPVQEGPDDDDRDAGEDRDGPGPTKGAADERGGVEEQRIGDADLTDQARGLPREQHLAASLAHATLAPSTGSVAA